MAKRMTEASYEDDRDRRSQDRETALDRVNGISLYVRSTADYHIRTSLCSESGAQMPRLRSSYFQSRVLCEQAARARQQGCNHTIDVVLLKKWNKSTDGVMTYTPYILLIYRAVVRTVFMYRAGNGSSVSRDQHPHRDC